MNWIELNNLGDLEKIKEASHSSPQLIFKHSTRCSISSMSKARLEREQAPETLNAYLLDLIAHRDISNSIAEQFNVHHESPQMLLIHKGKCVYDESHNGITMAVLKDQIERI